MPSPFWAHSTAVIDQPAEIGDGTKIWHFSHVMAGARIGTSCSLGQNVYVGAQAVIGNGCKVQNNVSLYDAVIVEDDVFVGPSAVFTNVVNPRAFVVRKQEYRPTYIRRGASIGANATIVCGCEIGAYAFVAAGAVVTHDVRPYSLVKGVPAKHSGWICRCGVPFRQKSGVQGERPLACPSCETRYVETSNALTPLEPR